MDLKTITKQLTLILLFLFIGQNCGSTKQCFANNKQKCQTKKTANNTTTAKHTHAPDHADLSLIQSNALEIATLRSQVQYLEEQIESYSNPSYAKGHKQGEYTKKIILNNGTTIVGNIIYQDDYFVQAETVLGTLSLDRYSIVRVVDYEAIDIEIEDQALLALDDNTTPKSQPHPDSMTEVVLLGEFTETQDDSFNTLISGTVKNIGPKRADFSKVTLTVYKNQNDNTTTKDYTGFIRGSTVAFDHGAISNSSLYPNSIGEFSVLVPSDFGPFLSYSYRIDWEVYE